MAAIASASEIAAKWARVTPLRATDYEDGIRNPRTDWATSTAAANDAWKAGVQQAIAADSFRRGVASAGTATWQANAISKGPARWQQGVAAGAANYEGGFAPYRDAIERLTLPPRFAKRDPRNLDRVKAVVDALIKVKTGKTAA